MPQGRLKALTAGLSEAPPNSTYPVLPEVNFEFNLIEKAGVSTRELLNQQFTSKVLEKQIDKQLDTLLRTRNQSRLEAIELLVLSTCETATGYRRAALGLAGLAVRAGARSTLASLWHIDAQTTAIFVGEFYRELAKVKVTKAEALRRAQLTLVTPSRRCCKQTARAFSSPPPR